MLAKSDAGRRIARAIGVGEPGGLFATTVGSFDYGRKTSVDFGFNATPAAIPRSCSVSSETRVSNETELFAALRCPAEAQRC